MMKLLKAVRTIVIVLLSLILLINLWLIGARVLLRQELPKFLGFSQATVLSGSMEPVFSAGDMLIFRERERYEVGDIVIFRRGADLVTHRIVAEADGGLITRGDANNTEDPDLLDPSLIEGSLVRVLPGAGRVLGFLRTPLGLLLLVLAALVCVNPPHLPGPFRRKRGKREQGK